MTVLILAMRVKPRARRLAAWISMGHRAAATRAAYATPKAGLHMLVRVLAQELVDDGIAVNELVPGPGAGHHLCGVRAQPLSNVRNDLQKFQKSVTNSD